VLQRYHSERRWIRHIWSDLEWREMFPAMVTQSGYHKRLKAAQPLLCKAILTVAACCPSWFDDMWITDATPVPCGMSRETVKRSDLAGHGGYGYCASHSRWYWGLKLYLVCAGDGMPIMWCLANPKIGEREVLAALLQRNHRLIHEGQVLLADKGFAGKEFKKLTEAMGFACCALTAGTRPTATATSAASASGSNRSTRPSKANSISKRTRDALRTACSPASHNVSWPWQLASGTTGTPA
jgi:hypothetical protein